MEQSIRTYWFTDECKKEQFDNTQCWSEEMKDFVNVPHWSMEKWMSDLAKGGGHKERIQQCLNSTVAGALPCADALVLCTLAPLTCCGCSASMLRVLWTQTPLPVCLVTTFAHSLCLWLVSRVRAREGETPTASWLYSAGVCRGCPAGTHPCAPDAQAAWHRSQSANSCCAELCCVVVSGGASLLLDMVTAVALWILRDTSHHSWLISLADTTDLRLCVLQLFLLINASDSACCTFTRLNLTLGTAHRHSGFEDLQCFLQRLDFLCLTMVKGQMTRTMNV